MKQSTMIIGIIILFSNYALAAGTGQPAECLKTNKKRGIQILPCNEFNLTNEDGSTVRKTFSSVCLYKDAAWRLGKFAYNKKSNTHTFVPTAICDKGVNAMMPQESVTTESPSGSDYISGGTNTKVTKVKINKDVKWKSLITTNPIIGTQKIPIICYLSQSAGVKTAPLGCMQDPNGANFCEFRNIETKYYTGNWWVLYRSPNKQKMVVCAGGLGTSSSATTLAEYGEVETVPQKVSTILASDLAAKIPNPVFSDVPESEDKVLTNTTLPLKVSACYIGAARKPCLNPDPVSFEVWESSEELYTDAFRDAALITKPSGMLKTYGMLIKDKTACVNSTTKLQSEKDACQLALNTYQGAIADKVIAAQAEWEAKSSGIYPVRIDKPSIGSCRIYFIPTAVNIKVKGNQTVKATDNKKPYIYTGNLNNPVRTPCDRVEVVEN